MTIPHIARSTKESPSQFRSPSKQPIKHLAIIAPHTPFGNLSAGSLKSSLSSELLHVHAGQCSGCAQKAAEMGLCPRSCPRYERSNMISGAIEFIELFAIAFRMTLIQQPEIEKCNNPRSRILQSSAINIVAIYYSASEALLHVCSTAAETSTNTIRSPRGTLKRCPLL